MSSLLLGDNDLALESPGDALAIIGSGLPGCVITESDLPEGFFDLKNGVAGEVLQKFVNYRFRVGFVLKDPKVHGERVVELIRDHATHPCVRFFGSEEEAEQWILAGAGSEQAN